MVILIIGGILFFLGAIVVIVAKNLNVMSVAIRVTAFGLLLAFGGAVYCAITSASRKPRSYTYPASMYELKLSITEYDGQKDTTYVLVEKLDSTSTNWKWTKNE